MTDAAEGQAPATPATPADSLLADQTPALDFSVGKPEGFPDDFWDAEKKAPAVDKLFNSYQQEKRRAEGLRVKLSKGEYEGKAPEDIKEYVLELDDSLKAIVPEGDPLMQAAKEAAKAAGLPKDAFSKFMTPVISKLAEFKAQAETPLSDDEIAEIRKAEISKLGPTGDRIVSAVGSFIAQMEANGTLSKDEAAAARAMATTADAVRVLNKFRSMSGMPDQVPVDMPVGDHSSLEEIKVKMAKAMMDGNEAEYNKYSLMLAKANR